MSVDPLAEKYASISPYVYVANNPVVFTDPNGKEFINVHTKRKEAAAENLSTLQTEYNEIWGEVNVKSLKRKRKRTHKKAQKKLDRAKQTLENETLFESLVESVINEFESVNPGEFNRWDQEFMVNNQKVDILVSCLLYTSPSPRD